MACGKPRSVDVESAGGQLGGPLEDDSPEGVVNGDLRRADREVRGSNVEYADGRVGEDGHTTRLGACAGDGDDVGDGRRTVIVDGDETVVARGVGRADALRADAPG